MTMLSLVRKRLLSAELELKSSLEFVTSDTPTNSARLCQTLPMPWMRAASARADVSGISVDDFH